MTVSLRNLFSEERRPPFQINQLLGKDFDVFTLRNHNYIERWIFPSNFPSLLTGGNRQIPVVRIFRYQASDKADLTPITSLDPIHHVNDRDVAFQATIEPLQNLFEETFSQKRHRFTRTTLSLDPLRLTLEADSAQANLLLEEITDADKAKSILKQVFDLNLSL